MWILDEPKLLTWPIYAAQPVEGPNEPKSSAALQVEALQAATARFLQEKIICQNR